MNFYEIRTDDKYKDIHYAEGTDWEGIVCPVYEGHQRAGDRIGDMQIELPDEGKRDFYWTFLSELVITDYLAGLLKSNGITGFKLKPVKVVNRNTNLKYWEFIPTGNGGLSYNYHLSYECKFCGAKKYRDIDDPDEKGFTPLKRVLVNEKNWDGSDTFTVEGLKRFILITEKVKDLIISNHLKGSVVSLAEYLKHQIYPVKKPS